MHIQYNDITPMTLQGYIQHPVTNSTLPTLVPENKMANEAKYFTKMNVTSSIKYTVFLVYAALLSTAQPGMGS
jgi:type IV secretory pathway VirB6-like protein